MRRSILSLIGIVLVMLPASPAPAQTDGAARAREAERREDEGFLTRRLPVPRMDMGGWLRTAILRYNKPGTDNPINMRNHHVVLWASRPLGEFASAYARVRVAQLDFNTGDQPEGDDTIGPNLDVGYLRIDMAGALNAHTPGSVSDRVARMDLTLGRQNLAYGSGLTLNRIHDAGRLSVEAGNWDLDLYVARSVGSQQDIDPSPRAHPDRQGESARLFYGGYITRTVFGAHRPYILVVYQDDRNVRPTPTTQNYEYQSRYFSLGSTGPLAPHTRYHVEYTSEAGHSFRRGTTVKPTDIAAHALFVEAEYRPRALDGSRVFLRAFGTAGDKTRRSPTDAALAHTSDVDQGFLAFGYLPTGMVLAATPANLRVISLGGAWHPLAGPSMSAGRQPIAGTRTLELGGALYRLRKSETEGGISDARADRPHADIGLEADVWMNWRPMTDLFLSVRGGVFRPGKGYTDRESRQLITVSLTLAF